MIYNCNSENMEAFNEKINITVNCFLRIKEKAEQLNNFHIVNKCTHQIENMEQDHFNVLVTGEFSSGKSTFVNALLGEKVFPSSKTPTTAIINKVSWGESEKYTLHFRDNSEEPSVISKDDFNKIVAPKDDKADYEARVEYIKKISYADIAYPIDICKYGVDFVDTPGTNDTDVIREEITFNYIPKSDIVLFILRAHQIFSASEKNYLENRILTEHIKNVFFIINFKDELKTHNDEQRTIDYLKKHISDIEGLEDPEIFLVSSRYALGFKISKNGGKSKFIPETFDETGFPVMEERLFSYLASDIGNAKLKKYSEAANECANELITDIAIYKSTLSTSLSELETIVIGLKQQLKYVKDGCAKVLKHLQEQLKISSDDYVRCYKQGLEEVSDKAVKSVVTYDGAADSAEFGQYLEGIIAPLQKENYKKINEFWVEDIAPHVNNAVDKINALWKESILENEAVADRQQISFEESNNDFKADIVSRNAIEYSLIGSGVIALFTVPYIAVPALIWGIFRDDADEKIGDFTQRLTEKFINTNIAKNHFKYKLIPKVRERYSGAIPTQIKEFKKSLDENFTKIVASIKEEADSKIANIELQYNYMLNKKRVEEHNMALEAHKLKDISSAIEQVKLRLKDIDNEEVRNDIF